MFGRKKILCDENNITKDNIVQILREAYADHSQNSAEIEELYNYYKGDQPILQRTKTIRPEICNKLVENRANEIVSFKTGYLCGEPIQYVSRDSKDEVIIGIRSLNDMMLLCGKSARDKELAEWMYIAGQAYRITLPNTTAIRKSIIPKLLNRKSELIEDEAAFNIYTLDPRYAFVVYHSALGEAPVMGVKYIVRKDQRKIFSVYTQDNYYEIENDKITKIEANTLRQIPIVEYPLNNARIGSFEIVQSILDSINRVQSNRLDGIEQFIQSLIVLVNAEVDDDKAKQLREAGLITLKSFGDNKPSIDIIAEQLNQTETQTLIDYMYQTVLNIVGMPNRNGGSSTSDTGAATIIRDGWAAAEARAKDDELMLKDSERYFLKIVLRIMRDTVGTSLTVSDIEVKFTRRNYENLQSKAQVLDIMLKNPKIAPSLAFTHCGMFSDPEDAAKMSAEYYEQFIELQREELSLKSAQNTNNGGDAHD